jgi:hypothetical protein
MKKKIVEPLPELSPSRSSAGDGAINPADIDSHERLLAKAFTATEAAAAAAPLDEIDETVTVTVSSPTARRNARQAALEGRGKDGRRLKRSTTKLFRSIDHRSGF